jgi:SseB protein N-terminal domain
MEGPELVVVPAHPRAGDVCQVEFEVREQGDGHTALPVFSSVAALVRALGRCQPWVCVPLRVACEAADRAGRAEVVLDPGVSSSGQQWTTASLRTFGGEQRPHE